MGDGVPSLPPSGGLLGYYGCPPREVLVEALEGGWELVDLDVEVPGRRGPPLLPDTACRIIRNIADNALFLREELDLVVAAVGEDKCDQGRFLAPLLAHEGLRVLEMRNSGGPALPLRWSLSKGRLRKRVLSIMEGVMGRDGESLPGPATEPRFGFWGVPPNDLAVLDLFPEETHIYGWTRCVEAGRPADLELECHVDPGIPTVFFTQTFCPKAVLSRHLARVHRGLHLDVDRRMTASTRAVLEAFLELRKA